MTLHADEMGSPPPTLDGVVLHRVDTLDDACAMKRWLGERRPILAFDLETTGLKIWKDRIRLVQFGDAYQGWTIPWENWAGLAREVFAQYEGELVGHNVIGFDAPILERYGITLNENKVQDTSLMARLIDPTQPRGLKALAPVFIDPKASVAEAMLDKAMTDGGWNWATIPVEVPVYSVYAAMDTVLAARIYADFMPKVHGLCPLAYDLERTFSWTVMRMVMHGTRVDIPYTESAITSFQSYIDEVTQWCQDVYGVYAGSDEKVIGRMQQDGVQFTKNTPSGARPSLDKEVLEGLAPYHPLAAAVWQRRRVVKLVGTYLKNFIGMQDDGYMHPGMDTMGAATMRMSMELLQTLPRRSENNPLAITVRNCIVPSEGHVLMMCDFDQIEARAYAHLARDPALAAAFVGDFFLNMARDIFNDGGMVKADDRRQTTKNGWYSITYGAGAPKFAATAGVSLEQGEAFYARIHALYPGVRRFQQEVERVAGERAQTEGRPYVLSPLTRRRYFLKREDKTYALVNYCVQGLAAEILKMKTIELVNAGLGPYINLLVHDEVIADVPMEIARDVAPVVTQIMNDDSLLSVPIRASLELGMRWGEKGSVQLDQIGGL